ncbi:MAG: hypothetical protein DRH12_09180 [Deltaproteobacteria bacterium]|nr:MAG: hypothetical protein DRH12_09180 [Deltaproteobacteria bacterium]
MPRLESREYLKLILDTIPVAILIVDRDQRVIDSNRAASKFLIYQGKESEILCGDAMACINALNSEEGCGTSEFCEGCVIRSSLMDALEGVQVTRRYGVLSRKLNGKVRIFHLLVSGAAIELEGRTLALITLEDITELYELREIIPICSWCQKIRIDEGYWEKVDMYLQEHKGMKFSHGICPECKKKLYPEFD